MSHNKLAALHLPPASLTQTLLKFEPRLFQFLFDKVQTGKSVHSFIYTVQATIESHIHQRCSHIIYLKSSLVPLNFTMKIRNSSKVGWTQHILMGVPHLLQNPTSRLDQQLWSLILGLSAMGGQNTVTTIKTTLKRNNRKTQNRNNNNIIWICSKAWMFT